MIIKECKHCIQKVLFDSEGRCPNCGKDKSTSPSRSREAVLRDEKIKDLKDGIEYRTKSSISLLIGGGLLLIASTAISVFTLAQGTVFIGWYGGIIAGLGLLARGDSDLRRKKYLVLELEKLVN